MKPLISPAEVIRLAFGSNYSLHERDIPESTILAAQYRLLRPMVGRTLYSRLVSEEEATATAPSITALAERLRTPLALYVVALLLPSLAARVGSLGVVRLEGEGFESADEATVARLCSRLRHDADALLDEATDYLLDNPTLYPDYNPHADIRRHISLSGGILLGRD